MAELDWWVMRRVEGMFKGADQERAIRELRRIEGNSVEGGKRIHRFNKRGKHITGRTGTIKQETSWNSTSPGNWASHSDWGF